MSDIRVRFAPSPTGHLHIGGARTALFNYLFARHHGGAFILRLEDTDVERSTEESVAMILSDLKWLGLLWDEGPEVGGPYGPYRQMERREHYRAIIDQLLANGRAYRCFCSAELLENRRQQALAAGAAVKYDGTCRTLSAPESQARAAAGETYTVRLKMPATGQTVFDDLIHGKLAFDNEVLDDFILMRTNGMPTYNYAAVVDDIGMRISHIIRGDDHISNTPRQICLYQAIGADLPAFAHVPMILGPDRTRLSKRHGATSVGAYEEEGYLPEALLNYLALLGWAYDDKTTLFSRSELEEKFSLEKVSKNPAVFDPAKLLWMNGVYIRNLSQDHYQERALAEMITTGLLHEPVDDATKAWAEKVALTVKDHIKRFNELEYYVTYFFGDTVLLDQKAREKLLEAKNYPELFKTLHAQLSMLESFSSSELEMLFRKLVEESRVKFATLVHPLRAAITGRVSSPGIFDVMLILGKERVLKRLAEGLASIGIQVGKEIAD